MSDVGKMSSFLAPLFKNLFRISPGESAKTSRVREGGSGRGGGKESEEF